MVPVRRRTLAHTLMVDRECCVFAKFGFYRWKNLISKLYFRHYVGFFGGFEFFHFIPINHTVTIYYYSDSPHSTSFMLPGIRNIAEIVLFMDWFSTKISIYDFWIVTVRFWIVLYRDLTKWNPTKRGLPYYTIIVNCSVSSWVVEGR